MLKMVWIWHINFIQDFLFLMWSNVNLRELWNDEQSSRVRATWHGRFSHDATARNDGTAEPHDTATNDDGKQRTNDARKYVSYAGLYLY